jgi:hypothetical protein
VNRLGHFDIADWTDFTRGCAADADRASMQAHLAGGCRRCRATVELVQRMVVAVRADGLHEPPDNVVRCAKAISALQRPRATGEWSLARLVYDSLRQPLPAGIRADARAARHAVFEAGDLLVELRLERELDQPLVRMVGQLTRRDDPEQVLTASPVLLLTRNDVLAHAVSNRFGEFQMDYAPARDLRLRVALAPPDQRIELLLSELAGPEPAKKRVRGSRQKKRVN